MVAKIFIDGEAGTTGLQIRERLAGRRDLELLSIAADKRKDQAERKRLLLEYADAVVIMVGGTGTLDEATEILELKKHGHSELPVVLLNTAGFYDGLKEQFRRMEIEGFLPRPLAELVFFAEEPVGVLAYLEESLGVQCKGGLASRVERVVVLTLGLLLAEWWPKALDCAVGVLAVTAALTVVQRVIHVHRALPDGRKPRRERSHSRSHRNVQQSEPEPVGGEPPRE